ncbi:hypothetical protein PBAL39_09516 [Pedobacter sp. BAL39]|uniref:DUF4271 domain-containing protein n=1 Tax=Pedobacter sp. BAL39 TaxID=391596 RepID=UPI0001559CCD|nr:DUF4271 domain-containing protein [Pedobacter sp. BAL39]EDM37371.1 hypothetical protein PBAL39_09516 [Pedobacter sp. BAL39]
MNLIRIVVVFLFTLAAGLQESRGQVLPVAQSDSLTPQKPVYRRMLRDSAYYANLAIQRKVTDSIITHTWAAPDSLISKHLLIDSILKANTVGRSGLYERYKDFGELRKNTPYRKGTPLPKGELWILAVIAVLLMVFSALRFTFAKQLQSIIQAFFSNRVLNNLNKEDNLFTSWPFLLLFIQFGFTLGMFFYLTSQYYNITFSSSGFQFYVSISILVVILYALKIIILRVLGYLFNVQKAVNEYVSILYLSYFNLSLLFMPLVIAFALSPLKYGPYYVAVSFILLAVIFVFQFIRAGINILSHYRFSKVYLFLYFCALEICPILILIKAIGF